MKEVVGSLGRKWTWFHNYEHSEKGRIWVSFDANRLKVLSKLIYEQLMHFEVQDRSQDDKICFSAVYGLHTIADKKPL